MTTTQTKLHRLEDRLESLEETVELLVDKKLLGAIKKSLDDIKAGRYKDFKDVRDFGARFETGS